MAIEENCVHFPVIAAKAEIRNLDHGSGSGAPVFISFQGSALECEAWMLCLPYHVKQNSNPSKARDMDPKA
jgi:hypothetical protein